mmetsp:Transcript_21940/g.37465  ORF Transcript_21940/g.37465 Transcript_21940/m.37465 type:complete len:268 (+) Transcript_21940:255-1058(+)
MDHRELIAQFLHCNRTGSSWPCIACGAPPSSISSAYGLYGRCTRRATHQVTLPGRRVSCHCAVSSRARQLRPDSVARRAGQCSLLIVWRDAQHAIKLLPRREATLHWLWYRRGPGWAVCVIFRLGNEAVEKVAEASKGGDGRGDLRDRGRSSDAPGDASHHGCGPVVGTPQPLPSCTASSKAGADSAPALSVYQGSFQHKVGHRRSGTALHASVVRESLDCGECKTEAAHRGEVGYCGPNNITSIPGEWGRHRSRGDGGTGGSGAHE